VVIDVGLACSADLIWATEDELGRWLQGAGEALSGRAELWVQIGTVEVLSPAVEGSGGSIGSCGGDGSDSMHLTRQWHLPLPFFSTSRIHVANRKLGRHQEMVRMSWGADPAHSSCQSDPTLTP
jgi:hypothetical protein